MKPALEPITRPHFRSSISVRAALLLAIALPLSAQVMQPHNRLGAVPAKPSAIVPAPQDSQPASTIDSAVPAPLIEQPPSQAVIKTSSGSLTIEATNASLTQTLQRISEKTGMKVDGVSGDERVFGTFGPGSPREVLNTLLHGTAYNVIMVGTLADGAPRELVLSQRTTGSSTQAAPQQQQADPQPADDDTPDPQPDDSQSVTPPPGRPMGPGPGGQMQPPRTPQDLLQQLRQQQQQQGQPQG